MNSSRLHRLGERALFDIGYGQTSSHVWQHGEVREIPLQIATQRYNSPWRGNGRKSRKLSAGPYLRRVTRVLPLETRARPFNVPTGGLAEAAADGPYDGVVGEGRDLFLGWMKGER